MTYEVSGVPHEDVYRILPLIDKHLNNVIPYTGGRYEKQDIVEGVENKLFDLWIPINKETSDINGVVITQFTVYLNQCDLAEVVGRKGWVRKLKDDGFKQSVWIVEREFKNG